MKAKLTYQQGKEIKERIFEGESLTVTTKVDSLISIYDKSNNILNMHPDYFISFEYVEEFETKGISSIQSNINNLVKEVETKDKYINYLHKYIGYNILYSPEPKTFEQWKKTL